MVLVDSWSGRGKHTICSLPIHTHTHTVGAEQCSISRGVLKSCVFLPAARVIGDLLESSRLARSFHFGDKDRPTVSRRFMRRMCGVASTTIAEHVTNLLIDRTCVRYAGFCVLVWGELMFGKRGGRNEIMTWRPYFPRVFSPNVGFQAMSLLQFLAVSCICQFCHEEVAVSLHLFSTGASWPVMNHTLFEPFTMSVS